MTPLEQRRFGRTGEHVSVIGLGGAALYKHSYEQGVATVRHALDLGVTYFDTSPAYGRADAAGRWTDRGMSQLIMGEGLAGTTQPHLLATKLDTFRTLEDCRAQLQDNLRALRRDRVDVLLGHSIQRATAWIPDAADDQRLDLDAEIDYAGAPLIQALREAKARGLCRYIGLSADESKPLAHILNRVELDMCLSANEYTLLVRRSPRIVAPVVRAQGIAYVVGGIFRGASPAAPSDASPSQLAARGPLAQAGGIFSDQRLITLAETTGISIPALTVRFLLADREVATILAGASTPEELEESVVAAQAGPLPPDIHQAVAALSP
jgi:aryl-alcohol dehydrogenase-like predicted oxidoreductase